MSPSPLTANCRPDYFSHLRNRISERWWEWRLGIQTRGAISPERLGCRDDAVEYSPVPFRGFFHAMSHVPYDLLRDCFVDYGAGKGRAMVLAARYYDFHRVLGVEMNPELCLEATRNFKRAATPHAEILCTDAATYDVPGDARVFFFFNPFFGETMRRVVHNLRKSLCHSRRFAIVVLNPRNFRDAIRDETWLIERSSGEILPLLRWSVFTSVV